MKVSTRLVALASLLALLLSFTACSTDDGEPTDTSDANVSTSDVARSDTVAVDTIGAADTAGVSTDAASPDVAGAPPEATFACAQTECTLPTEYCSVVLSGVPGGGATGGCADTPAACASDYTCACFATAGAAGDCRVGQEGGLTLTLAAP